MYRRQPTRIELKLDDLQEYDTMKKEWDEKKSPDDSGVVQTDIATPPPPKVNPIHERIGYKPEPHTAN
uniref:Anaphase-promoting complex subunit CDC26 n=1 Tax=Ornithodoros turicata TaxID=34597 RepID=A0A2R5LHE8_9ACAR